MRKEAEAQARPATHIKRHSHAEVSPRKRNNNTQPQETKPKRPRKNSRSRIELRSGSAQQRPLSESTRSPLKRKNPNKRRCEDCFERSRSPQLRKCEARIERLPKPIGRSPQLRKAEARVEVEARVGKGSATQGATEAFKADSIAFFHKCLLPWRCSQICCLLGAIAR